MEWPCLGACPCLGKKVCVYLCVYILYLIFTLFLSFIQIYDHILGIEREVYWIFGNVTCAAYPLEHIDTISEAGEVNTKSAMYQIIYGVSSQLFKYLLGLV